MKKFVRLTIDDMEEKRAKKELEEALAEVSDLISEKINASITEVIRELGYNYHDDMTPEEIQQIGKQMKQDGIDIVVDDKMEGNIYKVDIKVVQVARAIEFDLGGA
ncbi:hypothetical protein E5Z46_18860 [Geobacillus kaustophilus NBRC 102445]|uniref:hypothetical protein n=1 Tax=Geobacillus kaustophilus TaxID=1462 RepID=UPI0010BE6C8D|nr:hypothetical protein [Geobacillus kaustophilus]QCK84075.1 hypothetical protein E5Z46_18860 [Geobacillus kaustophilus NBRC 102445]QHB48429.1 hypothetical protein GBK1_22 [Geobacillus phage GBK1]